MSTCFVRKFDLAFTVALLASFLYYSTVGCHFELRFSRAITDNAGPGYTLGDYTTNCLIIFYTTLSMLT